MNAQQKRMIAAWKAARRAHNPNLCRYYRNHYQYRYPGRSITADSRMSAISAWNQA
jgi:hypothetical protein